MSKSVLNGQKGFTLIELLAVMAIIGILAAVVLSSTSDAPDRSDVAANQQSASALDSAAVDFVAAQEDAAIISDSTVTVVIEINSDGLSATSSVQQISSRHPEKFITANASASSTAVYNNEFPTSGVATADVIVDLVLLDSDGNPISRADFLEGRTAIDVASLEKRGFLTDTLDSATSLTDDTFHNILWVFEKVASSESDDLDARVIEGFRLISITETEGSDDITLRYEQFF